MDSQPWSVGELYEVGDRVLYAPPKKVSLTGWAWLWAFLTMRPRYEVIQGDPIFYIAKGPVSNEVDSGHCAEMPNRETK